MFCDLCRMPRPFPDRYTHNHQAQNDGSVAFECSRDSAVWPWLRLSATHPILVQTINFWASIDSGEFLGTFNPDTWTALTHVRWECGAPDAGLPHRGTYQSIQDAGRARYKLAFFDQADQMVAELAGQGVTFRTRNFEKWRDGSKEKLKPPAPPLMNYASAAAVGVRSAPESFLAPLRHSETISTTGLITKENGLRPAHPYIGGSGDHVNSTHMGEVGRQFGQLLLGRPFFHTGGEMEFHHYVELGSPFGVELLGHSVAESQFDLIVRQGGRDCTTIKMQYAEAQ